MKWLRRITLIVATLTFVAYLGSDRLRAVGCTGGIYYFNYGWEGYGCGPYTQGNACADATEECFHTCYYLNMSYSLDSCYEYQVGDPSDGWYDYDARCTCYN